MGHVLRKEIRDNLDDCNITRDKVLTLVNQLLETERSSLLSIPTSSKSISAASYNRFAPQKADSAGVSIEKFQLFCDAINLLTRWNLPYFQFVEADQISDIYTKCGTNVSVNEQRWDRLKEASALRTRLPLPRKFKLHNMPGHEFGDHGRQESSVVAAHPNSIAREKVITTDELDPSVQHTSPPDVIDPKLPPVFTQAVDVSIHRTIRSLLSDEILGEAGKNEHTKSNKAFVLKVANNKQVFASLVLFIGVVIAGAIAARRQNAYQGLVDEDVTMEISVLSKDRDLNNIVDSKLPISPRDSLQFKVSSRRPLYFYLLWLDPDGAVTPFWPWREMSWTSEVNSRPTTGFSFPDQRVHFEMQNDSEGIHSVLLLASENAISEFTEIRNKLESLNYKQSGLPAILDQTLVVLQNGTSSPTRNRFPINFTATQDASSPTARLEQVLGTAPFNRLAATYAISFAFGDR
jgi:hypothetical protein